MYRLIIDVACSTTYVVQYSSRCVSLEVRATVQGICLLYTYSAYMHICGYLIKYMHTMSGLSKSDN